MLFFIPINEIQLLRLVDYALMVHGFHLFIFIFYSGRFLRATLRFINNIAPGLNEEAIHMQMSLIMEFRENLTPAECKFQRKGLVWENVL